MRKTKISEISTQKGDKIAEIYDIETRADVAQYFGSFYYRR